MTQHEKDLFFETLELLRKSNRKSGSDWKDVDDWIFSELNLTTGDLDAIYAGRDAIVYGGSAIEGPAPRALTFEELEPFIGTRLLCRETSALDVEVYADIPGQPVLFTNADVPGLGTERIITWHKFEVDYIINHSAISLIDTTTMKHLHMTHKEGPV